MAEQNQLSFCEGLFACMFICVLIPGAIVACITLIVIACMSKDAVYSVTVTGVAGLDLDAVTAAPAAANNLSTLSPVFNLTVRIDNAHDLMSAGVCIGRLSTVAVSYGDAVLARGSVPEFCAAARKVRERGARAWAKDVDLPQFLRDQLAGELAAGEASVDVKVTTPAASTFVGDTVLVCSQVKIGGGPVSCRMESVAYYHERQANPGSTG